MTSENVFYTTETQYYIRARLGSDNAPIFFRAKRFCAKMHKGTFPRATIRARKRTLVHLRAETLSAEKMARCRTLPARGRVLLMHERCHTYIQSTNALRNGPHCYRRRTTLRTQCTAHLPASDSTALDRSHAVQSDHLPSSSSHSESSLSPASAAQRIASSRRRHHRGVSID